MREHLRPQFKLSHSRLLLTPTLHRWQRLVKGFNLHRLEEEEPSHRTEEEVILHNREDLSAKLVTIRTREKTLTSHTPLPILTVPLAYSSTASIHIQQKSSKLGTTHTQDRNQNRCMIRITKNIHLKLSIIMQVSRI